jgi:hypothetical protein
MSAIPEHLEEITPEWLTEALRTRGWLSNGRVREIERELLGAGAGFMGVIARLRVDFEGDPGGAPTSLVAKLPTPIESNRVMGEILGAYWREIHFYQEMGASFPVRVPALYYADLTPDPLRERQDEIIGKVDRLPNWLLLVLMWSSSWLVRRNAHRYILLIEDLAPARVGDQLGGVEPSVCSRVLDTAATLHASFWEKPVLDERFWLANQNAGPRSRQRMYWNSRKTFRKLHGHRLHGERVTKIDWLERNGVALNRALHRDAPRTLLHCDFRLDNVFFGDESAEGPEVILADWQLTGVGAAAYDVAYLMSGVLRTDATPDDEQQILRGYHEGLVRRGVVEYPFESLLRDYRRSLFAVFQVVASTDQVDLGNGRGVELMDQWIDRTLNLLERVPLDEVL